MPRHLNRMKPAKRGSKEKTAAEEMIEKNAAKNVHDKMVPGLLAGQEVPQLE